MATAMQCSPLSIYLRHLVRLRSTTRRILTPWYIIHTIHIRSHKTLSPKGFGPPIAPTGERHELPSIQLSFLFGGLILVCFPLPGVSLLLPSFENGQPQVKSGKGYKPRKSPSSSPEFSKSNIYSAFLIHVFVKLSPTPSTAWISCNLSSSWCAETQGPHQQVYSNNLLVFASQHSSSAAIIHKICHSVRVL